MERQSRFVMLIKVPSRDTAEVVGALSKHVRKLPATLRRSLTWDRGLEMAKHKDFTVATDVKVYFCDPQSPWQRGSNENTNGLLRQYFPKNTDLSDYSQSDLNKVALRLNQRPRETLGFQTPASKLQESVASSPLRPPGKPTMSVPGPTWTDWRVNQAMRQANGWMGQDNEKRRKTSELKRTRYRVRTLVHLFSETEPQHRDFLRQSPADVCEVYL